MNKINSSNITEEQPIRQAELFNRIDGAEDVSRREKHAKHFDLGKGRYQAVVYSDQVHFADENGVMQEIDNNLESSVEHGRSILRNRANPMKVEFPVQTDGGDLVKIRHNGRTLSWRMENEVANAIPTVRNGAALKREMLVEQATRMKGRIGQKMAAADISSNAELAAPESASASLAVKATPAALSEFISPDLDANAVSNLIAAEDVATLSDEQLEKAVFSLADRRADITHLSAEISYANLRPGVSARYRMEGMRIKEDIIAENAAALSDVALLLCNDFLYNVDDQQRVEARDKNTGEVCFIFDPPMVYDAAGNQEIASVSLEVLPAVVRMTYNLSEEFLASAVYPVTIDPVVKTSLKATAVTDGYIWAKYPSNSYTSPYMMRCGQGEGGESISLIKFNKLVKQRASDTIIAAYLTLYASEYGGQDEYFAIHPLVGGNVASATWNNMKPSETTYISNDIIAYITSTSATAAHTFDITNLCRSWYKKDADGNSQNKGIAVRYISDCGTSDKYVQWYATTGHTVYCPRLVVDYVSHAGLESWWQYEQMSAGRAGTAYVDIYNGNLVYEHADTATTGNLMPVSVSHYYNSCLSESDPVYCGMGWRTSMNQYVYKTTLSSVTYYVWVDGDGTKHYFEATGSSYEDSEGMKLKMKMNTSNITITDKSHNIMTFEKLGDSSSWFLISVTDGPGNTMTLTYDGTKLKEITDGAGRKTIYTYDASTGLLASVSAPNGLSVSYTYDTYTEQVDDTTTKTHHRLTGITYSDLNTSGPHTTFSYMENPANESNSKTNMLTSFQNFDGQKVSLSYQTNYDKESVDISDYAMQCLKVDSMELTNGDVKGSKILINYLDMTTKITSVDSTDENGVDTGKTITYQFNDAGNVVCMFDELGYAQCTKFSSSVPNTATKSSRLQKVVVNHLLNVTFGAVWASVVNSGDTAARATTDADRCLNTASVKITKASAGETKYHMTVTALPAGKYTFSSYVRTDGITGGGAFVRMKVGDTVYESRKVSASTASLSGGPGAEGWERIFVTGELAEVGDITVEVVCDGSGGAVYFACPQLEDGIIPNRVNLILNGDFRRRTASGSRYLPDDWAKESGITTNALNTVLTDDDTLPAGVKGNVLQMCSRPHRAYVTFKQFVYVKGVKGDSYVVGGWLSSKSIAKIPGSSAKNAPQIMYRFYNGDTAGSWTYLEFSREWVGWQFGCWPIVATGAHSKIEVRVNYARNAQTCRFTNIFLYKEQFGETFAYDDNKNVTSVANLSETKSSMEYDSFDNLTSYIQPGGEDDEKYTMTYGSTDAEKKKHLLRTSTTPMGIKQSFDYDVTNGNQTGAATVDDLTNPTMLIKTKTEYTADGNYPLKSYDARGNVVTKEMDTDYTLKSVTDPVGQKVEYGYDDSKRVELVQTTVTVNGVEKVYKNEYTYQNDRLETVKHNTTDNNNCDVIYTFGYDALGRKTTVKVGSQTLSTNVYSNDRNGILKEVQYGNGGKVVYEHDDFDRITGVKYDSETTPRYTYEYGANGQAAFMKDNNLNRIHQTEYDLAERPIQSTIRDTSDNLIYRTTLTYDGKNRLETFAESLSSEDHKTTYTYDKDNRTTEIQYDDATHKVNYTYDALGRVISRAVTNGSNVYSSSYAFEAGNSSLYGSGASTPLVKTITQGSGNTLNFSYEYDERGNIISETRNGNTTTYAYDALGQLVSVNDPHENAIWEYTYDLGGNITKKQKFARNADGSKGTAATPVTYTYGDSNWKDKLTAYNGQTITYDEIGNPLTDGTWTYTWSAGRQLKKMVSSAKTVEFMYNAAGLRVQKKVTEGSTVTTTDYTLHGKLITHQKTTTVNGNTTTTTHMHFFYDNASRPAMVKYNGVLYTYVHNLQGDIVGIVDASGNLVVEYKYDAWGRKVSISGSQSSGLGTLNPFRYRGYVYDVEMDLYYLRSRYYNAVMCKFISPDTIYTGNLYAYCYAEPLEHNDTSGNMPVGILNALSGAYNNGLIESTAVTTAVIILNGGNIYNGFHEIAQLNVAKHLYSMGYSPILEYKIDGVGEADIVAGIYIWEVKPMGTKAIDQPEKYVAASGLNIGFDIDTLTEIPIIDKIKMKVSSSGNGILHYSFYRDNSDVQSSNVKSAVSKKLFWATLAFGAIIGVTVLEDMLSGGLGVTNDIPSLGFAGGAASLVLGL